MERSAYQSCLVAALRSKTGSVISVFVASLAYYAATHYAVLAKAIPFSKYYLFASQYIQGAASPERIPDFSPLYLYANVIVLGLVPHAPNAMLWPQLLAVSASCALLFLLLKSFFSIPVSVFGMLLFLLNRSVLLYSSVNEPEPFLILFLLGFLVCLVRKSDKMAFLSGVFLALCLLTRLNLLPLVVMAPVALLLMHDPRPVRRVVLLTIPTLLCVLGLSARNYGLTHTFSPMVMNPGNVFFEGNNPNANGHSAVYPPMVDNLIDEFQGQADPAHDIYRFLARRIAGKELSVGEVNSFWAGKAWNFISDNPAFWLRRLASKILSMFHSARWHDIATVISNDRELQNANIPAPPFGAVAALCVLGLFASLKDWRKRLILYAILLCQFCAMGLTYSSDRQRVAVVSIMIFFACAAVQAFLDRSRSLRSKVICGSITTGLSLLFCIDNQSYADGLRQRTQFDLAQQRMNKALQARDSGDLKTASMRNAESHAYLPYYEESRLSGLSFGSATFGERALIEAKRMYGNASDGSSRLDLVTLLLENGLDGEAEPFVRELIRERVAFSRSGEQSSQPHFYLARIEEIRQHRNEAVASLRKALAGNPGDPWALSHLCALTGDDAYKRKLVRYLGDIDADYFMGLAFFATGQIDRAAASFAFVVQEVPEFRDGHVCLAIALGGKGDFAEAARQYSIAMQKRPEPLFKEKEVVRIFREWAAAEPDSAKAQYFLAVTLKDFGRYDEAKDVLVRLRDRYPMETSYSQHIAEMEVLQGKYR